MLINNNYKMKDQIELILIAVIGSTATNKFLRNERKRLVRLKWHIFFFNLIKNMLRSIVIVMGIVKTIVHFAPWVGDIYIQMAIAVLLTLATDSLTERLSNALSNVIVSLVESIPEKINLAYQIYLKSNTKKKK